ncbi:MAG: tRNA 2-thiouridine(34) synthase MnmA, partial [Lentisphaeria bacterium]
VDELQKGRTPSPDILCNERVKFGAFFDFIDESYDKVATGHYAQVEQIGDKFVLKRAPDPIKDQTYFLSSLRQDQLSRALFPIGHLQKNEVRNLAEKYNLPTKVRKDSQGICFLGKIKYNDFVKFNLGEKVGDIIELETGKKWGTHQGFWFHTIGQRTGLGLHGGPWYVVKKDIHRNIIYISHQSHRVENARTSFIAAFPQWIEGKTPENTLNLHCKLRHGPELIGCNFLAMDNGDLAVQLTQSDAGIAPGQSVIFYDGEICLGRAIISE